MSNITHQSFYFFRITFLFYREYFGTGKIVNQNLIPMTKAENERKKTQEKIRKETGFYNVGIYAAREYFLSTTTGSLL